MKKSWKNMIVLPGSTYGRPSRDGREFNREVERKPLKIDEADYRRLYSRAGEDITELADRAATTDLALADAWALDVGGGIKHEENEEVKRQVEDYLKAGGEITKCRDGDVSGVFDGRD